MITMVTTDFGSNPAAGTPEWFAEVKRLGYRGFGTSVNRWASTEFWPDCGVFIDCALTAGFFVGVYCRYPEGWENGLNGMGADLAAKLKMFVLDVEPESDGLHPVEHDHVDGLVKRDQRPMIYTNSGMWPSAQGGDPNDVSFATVALWDRALRAKAPTGMGQAPLVPFAGWNQRWTRRRVWQYADPATVAGVDCTLNVVDGRWL